MASKPKASTAMPSTPEPARQLVDRLTVVDDGGFVEILADGETLIGESGTKGELVREIGRLIEREKTGHSARVAALIATGNELLRSAAIPDDWKAPFTKALADAEGNS